MQRTLCFLLSFCLCIQFSVIANEGPCQRDLVGPPTDPSHTEAAGITEELHKECGQDGCSQSELRRVIYQRLVKVYKRSRTYAFLVAAMVASSMTTIYLSSLAGNDYPFLSQFLTLFLGQITTLGFIVVGAPIWEPLTSKLREFVYRRTSDEEVSATVREVQDLERMFFRTNRALSLNAQMSRNILRDYTHLAVTSLCQAKSNFECQWDREMVEHQVAEIIHRLHRLYPEIDPNSDLVVNAVHSNFTQFIDDPQALIPGVSERLQQLEPSEDFSLMLSAWLSNGLTN